MEFFLVVLILILLIRWAILRSRIQELENRINDVATQRDDRTDELIAALTRRVRALEIAAPHEAAPPKEAAATAPVVVPEVVTPPPTPLEPVIRQPEPEPLVEAPIVAAIPTDVPRQFEPEPPRVDFGERLRAKMGGQEWEALVGGNWLNKLGVLVLVIGIALLLSYSFTQTGPAGRVIIGVLVSFTMLVAGVVVERREGYRIFARGLLGGGWAALYFTVYAMHAIPAAKVIDDPYVASALLLVVATGMIVHSLRYRSQAVTGLAYFIAFATLVLADVTPFAVFALIPLAGSLLYVAYRFNWFAMAFFGLFATYGTLISRGDSGAPLATTQATFSAFWLLFEIFDLMRASRRDQDSRFTRFILPLNVIAFVLLSWHKWQVVAPGREWQFFAATTGAYLISTFIRVRVRPPASFSEAAGTLDRVSEGGYEGPVSIAAVLAAIAIFLRAPTVWINGWLLVEGELLFLVGVRFGESYLRRLAAAVFGVSMAKLGFVDVPADGATTIAGMHMRVWTPVALAHAVGFYLNRVLHTVSRAYSWAAAAIVIGMLTAEAPREYLAVAYFAFAVMLFELGFWKRLGEFRYQAYASASLGAIACVLSNIISADESWPRQWLPIAIATLISYAAAVRIRRSQPDRIDDWEATALRLGGSVATTVFALALVWKLAPGDYLGLAWIAVGALLFELGLRGFPPELRWTSYAALSLGILRLLMSNVFEVHKDAPVAARISLVGAALLCYAITARVFRSKSREISGREFEWVRDGNSFAGTTFLLTVTWVVLQDAVVALAWSAVALLLLEIGFMSRLGSFRLQGNLVAKLVFFRLFFANFTDLGHTGWLSHRVLTVLPVIASQYYIWTRYRDSEVSSRERNAARLYLYAAAIGAVVLSRFELGRVVTVIGWAVIALALYTIGARRNNADLRWQSYAITLLTFWRCWNTNFYIPESLAGLPGRVLTGSVVVAAFYAAQFIAPRPESATEQRTLNIFMRLDRHARVFFALLASTLLAVMLYYQVSGGLLTVAWTVQAMAMLVAGFPLRDRPLRLIGLLLFLVCILKVFLWDLRRLETLQRIMSFIVLGAILVGVSWIYTRFRDRIQRYL
jgi:predicted membrane protein DUF2339